MVKGVELFLLVYFSEIIDKFMTNHTAMSCDTLPMTQAMQFSAFAAVELMEI